MLRAKTGIALALATLLAGPAQAEPIYISFVWHMHQPIYWPGETVVETIDAAHWSFNVQTVHTDRSGSYTTWPGDAVGALRAAGFDRGGAQVSFSGSLMENLDALEAAGRGFAGWKDPWRTAGSWRTAGGHAALDLVQFGYFHPLSALIPPADLVLQLRLRALAVERRFPGYPASRGLFPPETAFSVRIIPALVEAGVEWVVVDNVHFDRTLPDYPYTPSSNLVPPNRADVRNAAATSWEPLDGIWAPSPVAAPWGYRPHRARYLDPAHGTPSELIVVPGARYEGNEDARGGFGALNYEGVLSQLEPYNTDDAHPMLVVLHHDGDNYGGGTDSYYHSNFAGFVSWLLANPTRFQPITIQEYLDRFPPAADDVIHVEDGSWSGADNGDPEFLKWNGDPAADGYSPDRNSWAVMTAAVNRVHAAAALRPAATPAEVVDGSTELGRAWRALLTGQTSCYWYWDGAEGGRWDAHPARAANAAVAAVEPILAGGGADTVPPTIYPPQREPYNPGELEWGAIPMPEETTIWTYVDDLSGLARVELWYRADDDGRLDDANELYLARPWCVLPMTATPSAPRTDPAPTVVADRYHAVLEGLGGHFIDYFVEALDRAGNLASSPIRHVWIGGGGTGPGPGGIRHDPTAPTRHDVVTVGAGAAGALHWGINGWVEPPAAYWPAGSTSFGDGHAVDSPLVGPDATGRYAVVLGPFDGTTRVDRVDYVIRYADGSWSSPDMLVPVDNDPGPAPSVELVEPADGAAVSGTVRLVAAAGDDEGPPRVEFVVDGAVVATDTGRPFEAAWDASAAAPGAHTVVARATDGTGHVAEDSAAVTVGGGGPVSCTTTWDGDGSLPPTDADADGDGDAGADADVMADADADAPADGRDAPDGGVDGPPDGGGGDAGDGCSCRVQPAGRGAFAGLFLLLVLGLASRRRR
jgi:MYXO-CTERM domain-containing protein